jgi:hypothetical protein
MGVFKVLYPTFKKRFQIFQLPHSFLQFWGYEKPLKNFFGTWLLYLKRSQKFCLNYLSLYRGYVRVHLSRDGQNQVLYNLNFLDMDDDLFTHASYLINGPLISFLFVSGTLLNFIVLYILQFRMYKRMSCYGNIIQASGQLALYFTIKKRRTGSPRRSKLPTKPQICIYLLWTTSCDIALLTSAFFTYSIPTLFECYTSFYAYLLPLLYTMCNATLTISVWHTFALMLDRWRALSSSLTDAINALLSTNLRIHKTLFIGMRS